MSIKIMTYDELDSLVIAEEDMRDLKNILDRLCTRQLFTLRDYASDVIQERGKGLGE